MKICEHLVTFIEFYGEHFLSVHTLLVVPSNGEKKERVPTTSKTAAAKFVSSTAAVETITSTAAARSVSTTAAAGTLSLTWQQQEHYF